MPEVEPTGLWEARCFLGKNGNGRRSSRVAHIIANEGGVLALCGVKGDCSSENCLTVHEAISIEDINVCPLCSTEFIKKEVGYDCDPT